LDDFTVTTAELDSARAVVAVHGELDLDTAERLWQCLGPLLVQDAVVVVDATLMRFMDSSGLRTLLRASLRARETGATVRVAALGGAAARAVELAGVAEQLAVRESVADALSG
jgi:anti-sigma B factor antagonist